VCIRQVVTNAVGGSILSLWFWLLDVGIALGPLTISPSFLLVHSAFVLYLILDLWDLFVIFVTFEIFGIKNHHRSKCMLGALKRREDWVYVVTEKELHRLPT